MTIKLNRRYIRQARALCASLGYDFARFEIDSFTACIERARGRPIEFVHFDMPAGIFGAWIRCGQREFVFLSRELSGVGEVHVRLHELAHILCGHPTLDVARPESLLEGGQGVLFRADGITHADPRIDQEAEALALVILQRVVDHRRLGELIDARRTSRSYQDYLKEIGVLVE